MIVIGHIYYRQWVNEMLSSGLESKLKPFNWLEYGGKSCFPHSLNFKQLGENTGWAQYRWVQWSSLTCCSTAGRQWALGCSCCPPATELLQTPSLVQMSSSVWRLWCTTLNLLFEARPGATASASRLLPCLMMTQMFACAASTCVQTCKAGLHFFSSSAFCCVTQTQWF